jgi:predicted dehydrogenase
VAPWIIPATVLGREGHTTPSRRITLAAIGLGGRGRTVLSHFLKQDDVQCLAVCDCFADRRARGKEMVDDHYGTSDCSTHRFHEEVLGRDDIDAVLIATGDRWHTLLSVLAARAGKDIYCEKPFSLTIAEGRTLVDTMKRYGTIWQCGTQRRSNASYRFVVEVVRQGRLGALSSITTSFGGWSGNGIAKPQPTPDPDVFDYNRWLGPSPWAPYSETRVGLWRNHWDTGAGVIADMGPHYFDFAQWAHDSELAAPVEFEGEAVWPKGGFTNVPFDIKVEARYADGVRLLMDCGDKGVRFDGEEGWIRLTDDGTLSAEPRSILEDRAAVMLHWNLLTGHVRNFLECIKTRRQPASHGELAQRCHTIAHCANIGLRLGRKVRWDHEHERFIDDEEANNMLSRTMRAPWQI